MESVTLHRPPPLPGRVQDALVVLLLAVAGVGWALTDERMSGMDAGPGAELGSIGWFIALG